VKKTEKQRRGESAWRIRRHIRLAGGAGEELREKAQGALKELRGVVDYEIGRSGRLTVLYDVTQLDYRHLIEALERVGLRPRRGMLDRLRGGLYQYADTNARENAKAPPPPCCNKPPR